MTIFLKKNSYLILRSGKFGNLVTSFYNFCSERESKIVVFCCTTKYVSLSRRTVVFIKFLSQRTSCSLVILGALAVEAEGYYSLIGITWTFLRPKELPIFRPLTPGSRSVLRSIPFYSCTVERYSFPFPQATSTTQ